MGSVFAGLSERRECHRHLSYIILLVLPRPFDWYTVCVHWAHLMGSAQQGIPDRATCLEGPYTTCPALSHSQDTSPRLEPTKVALAIQMLYRWIGLGKPIRMIYNSCAWVELILDNLGKILYRQGGVWSRPAGKPVPILASNFLIRMANRVD